jgi:hypothetical protein
LWIGIVLMQIQIRIFTLSVPIQIPIRICFKSDFFLLLVTALPLKNSSSFTSVSNVACFQYFGPHIKFFDYLVLICLEFIPIRIGMPWMPIPFLIRQNDADPTRSGSTTLTVRYDIGYRNDVRSNRYYSSKKKRHVAH